MSAEEYDEQADLKQLQEELNGTHHLHTAPENSIIVAVYMNDEGELGCQLPKKKPEWMSDAQFARWIYAHYKLWGDFLAYGGADEHINRVLSGEGVDA